MNTTNTNNMIKLVLETTSRFSNGMANPRLTGTTTQIDKYFVQLNMTLDEFCKKMVKPSKIDQFKYCIKSNNFKLNDKYYGIEKMLNSKAIKMFEEGKFTDIYHPVHFDNEHYNAFKSLYLYKEPTFTNIEL